MDVKWRGKGLSLPLPAIYKSRGATPPGTPRAAPIKCRKRHQLLTSEPHRAETDVHTHVRDHYGAAKGRSAPSRPPQNVVHYVRAVLLENACLLHTTAATTVVI
jgi:hypothetical protein